MFRDQLQDRLAAEPFEPFRIKLVNGDRTDVFDPLTVSVERRTIFVASTDGNWLLFPINKINSIESIMADFHGELAAHSTDQ